MKSSKPPEPETPIIYAILDLLKLTGIQAYRSNAGGGYRLGRGGKPQLIQGAPEGWPDITGWMPKSGKMLLIEVKVPGERPTQTQYNTMYMLQVSGGVALWCTSVDECHSYFQAIDKGYAVYIGYTTGEMHVVKRMP